MMDATMGAMGATDDGCQIGARRDTLNSVELQLAHFSRSFPLAATPTKENDVSPGTELPPCEGGMCTVSRLSRNVTM